MKYKIVDLFAGPGGLGEGFASYEGDASFEIAVSAEMEESAHKTLTLRSFFRHIKGDQKALEAYYDFCHSANAPHPEIKVPSAWKAAQAEANKLTLGVPADNARLDELIVNAELREEETVLIGGPPCQAYSLVGRSRNRGKEDYVAENDHRHFLYREYLRILNTTRPAVFVMENVKGILSSKVNGKLVFHDILRDLAEPGKALGKPDDLKYTIHSLVKPVKYEANMDPASLDANAFIIESEKYGIPPAEKKVLALDALEDGCRIRPAKTDSIARDVLPISVKVEFAYEGLDKDAFSEYDPLDFNLNDQLFDVTYSGCLVDTRSLNLLEFHVYILAANALYLRDGKMVRGAAGRVKPIKKRKPSEKTGRGAAGRLAIAVRRLSRTYDTHALSTAQMISVLPREFNSFAEKAQATSSA